MAKVTELIKRTGKFTYSVEVTPDVSEEEIDAVDVNVAFFSVTWHAKSHLCKDMNIGPLQTAKMLINKQKNVLLHVSCDMMKEDYLKQLIKILQDNKICNLFLILGESYDPKTSDFQNTSLLIKYIRMQTGNYFCIGIAGLPGCSDETLLRVKEKVEIGADFIITQAFFDFKTYRIYEERCRKNNINVPLIPGLFPFESYKQLNGFINHCKIKVSPDLLESIKNKEIFKRGSGFEIIKCLIQELHVACGVTHFHLFSLNKLQCINIFLQSIA